MAQQERDKEQKQSHDSKNTIIKVKLPALPFVRLLQNLTTDTKHCLNKQ